MKVLLCTLNDDQFNNFLQLVPQFCDITGEKPTAEEVFPEDPRLSLPMDLPEGFSQIITLKSHADLLDQLEIEYVEVDLIHPGS